MMRDTHRIPPNQYTLLLEQYSFILECYGLVFKLVILSI